MEEIRNLNKKRVCDISNDKRTIVILQGGCQTVITANADGTLRIEHERKEKTV